MRFPVVWTEPPDAPSGPAVLLVHGVGVGPAAFGPVAARLAAAGRRVGVVHRPGYSHAAGHLFTPLPTQVTVLSHLVDTTSTTSTGPGVVLVGVSGGATLALQVAIARARTAALDADEAALERGSSLLPSGAGSGFRDHRRPAGGPVTIVAHEPLVGPLAPDLHRRVTRAVGELALGTGRFVRHLVGEATWAQLDPEARATTVRRPDLVDAEARAFAAVAPTPGDLAAVRLAGGLVTSVGEGSGPERHRAAAALARLSGCRVEVVAGAGHLAHVDAPDAFADAVLAAEPAPAPAGARS